MGLVRKQIWHKQTQNMCTLKETAAPNVSKHCVKNICLLENHFIVWAKLFIRERPCAISQGFVKTNNVTNN